MICGMTGTGKTTLARYLLASCNRVIVLDPKHEFSLDGFRVNKNYSFPSPWQKEFRTILRPRVMNPEDDSRMAEFLLKAYKRKNITIYCDELYVIADSYPDTLAVLKMITIEGRSKHVSVWSATQRPRNFPRVFMTESEIFFVFRLQSEDDRDYVAGYIGKETEEKIPKFIFWYYRGEEENPRLLTLDLDSNKIYPLDTVESESSLSETEVT